MNGSWKKVSCFGTLLLGYATANAAILRMENAADGSGEVTLAPGESVVINLVIQTSTTDSLSAANLAFTYYQATSDCLDGVDNETGVSPWDCGHENLNFPCDLEDCTMDAECSVLPQGSGIPPTGQETIVDTFTVTYTGPATTEDVLLSFERIESVPLLFGPSPQFQPFTSAPAGFPSGFPNFLYLGDANSNNTPFVIHKITGDEGVDGDANGDGEVDPLDAGYVLARFGCAILEPDCEAADVNGDGVVDPLDVGYVLARFGN